MFDEAKRIFKLDLQDQLKNICSEIFSKNKKQLAAKIKLVPEPLMQHLKDKGIQRMRVFNMSRIKCLLLSVNSVSEIASVLCLLPLLFNNKNGMFIQYSDWVC